MPPILTNNPTVWTLARDLGLNPRADPLDSIVKCVRRQIGAFLKECPCSSLTDLLKQTAVRVNTLFVEVYTDDDLWAVKQQYVSEGELAFADLESQLSSKVFAITFKRQAGKPWDRQFISVIDCRGEKAARRYFSKWHEIAHLLTLTSQQRLKFCRSHVAVELKDPEEAVMDVIAGELGFYDDMVRPYAEQPLSFERIQQLRDQLCPDASEQASRIGFVKAWPQPCVLVEAEPALKTHERHLEGQHAFPFHGRPLKVLRATHVTPNSAARDSGLFIPRNMRVPERSVIARVFADDRGELCATEDLSWWSSGGKALQARAVKVLAKRMVDRAQALIMPVEKGRDMGPGS
jgi:hypothetical protein